MNLSDEFARRFSQEWVDSWNAHDLERILRHYAEDIEFSSPFVVTLGFGADGILRGKRALHDYWSGALLRFPDLRFELLEVSIGMRSLCLRYRSVNQLLAIEYLEFGAAAHVVRAAAHYHL